MPCERTGKKHVDMPKKGKAKRGRWHLPVLTSTISYFLAAFRTSEPHSCLSLPWQQPLVMLPSPVQKELSRQMTANTQHGPASNWKKARRHAEKGKAKRGKSQRRKIGWHLPALTPTISYFLAAFRTSEPHSCPRLGNSPWSCFLALHKHRNFHGK